MRVDKLQVSKFVQENIVNEKTTDSEERPLLPSLGAELLRRLALYQETGQAHARGQCTQTDFTMTCVNVPQHPSSAAPIIEVHCTQTMPQLQRKAAQYNTHLILVDVMNSVSTRNGRRKLNSGKSGLQRFAHDHC